VETLRDAQRNGAFSALRAASTASLSCSDQPSFVLDIHDPTISSCAPLPTDGQHQSVPPLRSPVCKYVHAWRKFKRRFAASLKVVVAFGL
jgi:hypothetical protein